jgi:hypothetical protein
LSPCFLPEASIPFNFSSASLLASASAVLNPLECWRR